MLKKIWNIISGIIVALFLLAAVALVGVRFFGYSVFAVLSGSMEPTYPTGSLIYVKKVDCRDLKVGDPITFMLSEDTVATHRIVEIVPDPDDPSVIRFATKGDANNVVDGKLVHCKNVIGEPVFCVPKVGYFVSYIQKPPGMYFGISAGAILLLLIFLPDLLGGDDKKKRRGEDEKDSSGRDQTPD